MRGEKGVPHRDEGDPPRRRANKAVGHGNWERDRPPVCGAVGRESGRVRLHVEHRASRATPERVVVGASREGAMAYTDEWRSYGHLPELGRGHATVCHAIGEWARDDDGNGIREVHDNTLEGMWTGLRNHPRTFRGVNKKYLHQYVAIFEWSYNMKRATPEFLRALLGIRPATNCRT
jgi:transposase